MFLTRVGVLAKRLAEARTWLSPACYRADPAVGFGSHLLHEELDHSLFVTVVSWMPGRGAPAHNHGTWGVVVGVEGIEKNTFWTRTDDRSRPGYAELQRGGSAFCRPGDVMTLPSSVIHSVANETDRTSLSFHVYGRHLNYTGRSQFNPEARTEHPFLIATQ